MVRLVIAPAWVAALLLLGVPGPAAAQTLIGNFPSNDGTGSTLSGGTPTSRAAGFTLAAGTDYQLNFVRLRLQVNNAAAPLTVRLHANSGANPSSTVLVNFTVPSFTLGTADYDFLPASPLTLAAGSTYWLVADGGTSTATALLWKASSPNSTPTGLATSAGYRTGAGGSLPTNTTGIFNTYLVDATPVGVVPEPASLALFGAGLAAVALPRRRWSRRRE